MRQERHADQAVFLCKVIFGQRKAKKMKRYG